MTARLGRVRVWFELEAIVAAELGELLGTQLRPATVAHTAVHASMIPLTLVPDHLSLKLRIGVDEASRKRLQDVLLGGDATLEALWDALREIANTAGGAIRRVALDEGKSFAVGLPSNEPLTPSAHSKVRAWTITDDTLSLECLVEVSPNHPAMVAVGELREGMVLAADVIDSSGFVVAAGGVALTQTTVGHIVSTLGAEAVVEISEEGPLAA